MGLPPEWGRLRAYGNSICAQLAEEFIRAYSRHGEKLKCLAITIQKPAPRRLEKLKCLAIPIQKRPPKIKIAGVPPRRFSGYAVRTWGSFEIDAAAADHNPLVADYWTLADNALVQDWSGKPVWCNPPYSDIGPWVEKAATAEFCVMLVPADTSVKWFAPAGELGASVIFITRGRLRFIHNATGKPGPSNKMGSCFLVFGGSRPGRVDFVTRAGVYQIGAPRKVTVKRRVRAPPNAT
uniref:Phage N-6-adenine-methyltransferase n=1 Tax=Edwardsiella phage eiAU TaxID=945083 RepID=E7EKP6_9CAUD|nr:phage N-6-adenine-methyltransferase [Edwardsiella phage eiAU]